MNDTIAAISTSLGGAISIIRVSGNESIEIVNKIFSGKDLKNVDTHTIHYGHIIYNNEKIDEVLISVMLAPKTFTMEDVVEINLHGGIATTNKVLEILLSSGCRLAEPGEFTKRAYLNGRIDLIEAESIMDLINSKTDKSRKLALSQLSGNVSLLIKSLRSEIVKILSNIEVNIDYPEYDDIEVITINEITEFVNNLRVKIDKIISESKCGKVIKNGIKTLIIGRPNVGKSSILNKLLDQDKAIVTSIPGTTRDIVEGELNIDGILLNMIDTAGIRETNDIVESIGVNKSLDLIEESDLILLTLNNNEEITDEDLKLYEKIKNKNHIIIVNKIDLEKKINLDFCTSDNIVYISTIDNKGLDSLKDNIKKLFNLEKIETDDLNYLSSSRSIAILNRINDALEDIEASLKDNKTIDMIEIDIKEIWYLLGDIIGENTDNALIDEMFRNFCLGK